MVENITYATSRDGIIERITIDGVAHFWAHNRTEDKEARFPIEQADAALAFIGGERCQPCRDEDPSWQQEFFDYQATQAYESLDALSAAGF